MNGLDASRHIREFNPTVPIVAVTASMEEFERSLCIDAGMTDILTKPVIATKLMAMIRAFLPPPAAVVAL